MESLGDNVDDVRGIIRWGHEAPERLGCPLSLAVGYSSGIWDNGQQRSTCKG